MEQLKVEDYANDSRVITKEGIPENEDIVEYALKSGLLEDSTTSSLNHLEDKMHNFKGRNKTKRKAIKVLKQKDMDDKEFKWYKRDYVMSDADKYSLHKQIQNRKTKERLENHLIEKKYKESIV